MSIRFNLSTSSAAAMVSVVMALLLVGCGGGSDNGSESKPVTASFVPGPSLGVARSNHTSTALSDGKVLVTGGVSDPNGSPLASAELYDPVTSRWSQVGPMSTARSGHTATLLQDGKVLIAGGAGVDVAVDLYDPKSNSWSMAGTLAAPRFGHTATLLKGGRVLLAAGYRFDGVSYTTTDKAELYDPATNAWSATGSFEEPRVYASAALLANGKVLLAGGVVGVSRFGVSKTASVTLFDPAQGTWSAAKEMGTARTGHALTPLNDGRVLVTGGGAMFTDGGSTAEIYDPATDRWTPAGQGSALLVSQTATLLPGGNVLVTGGVFEWLSLASVRASSEIYSPMSNAWSPAANMATARYGHTAALLSDGAVLVVGGTSGEATLASTEVFR